MFPMRGVCVAAVILCALSGSAVGASGPCPAGRTVASGERYRIVDDPDGGVIACLISGGRGAELIGVDGGEDLFQFTVAGRYIAYEGGSNASSGTDSWVGLADMKSGQSDSVADNGASVSRFVVRATGSIVWSSTDGQQTQINLKTIGSRRIKTLAESAGIEPLSLRRVGRRAVWSEDGERRSSIMP